MYVSDSEFSRMIEHRQKWLDHKRQILREKFAQKKCNFCAQQEEIMFECKGCHAVVYCNRSHQKRDWTFGHSVFCKTNRDHLQVIIVWPSLILPRRVLWEEACFLRLLTTLAVFALYFPHVVYDMYPWCILIFIEQQVFTQCISNEQKIRRVFVTVFYTVY